MAPSLWRRCCILALHLLVTTKAQVILLNEKSKSNPKWEDSQFVVVESSSSSKKQLPHSLTRGGSAASHQRSNVPSIHKQRSLSLLQSKEQSLSDHAAKLLKEDSSFVNRLRQEEEQQLRLKEPQHVASPLDLSSGPTPHAPTTNPWLLGGAAALITASSLYANDSTAMLQALLQKMGPAVILAWLPSILLGGGLGWIEIASLVGLLLRPPVRQLLVYSFFPSLWTAVQKIAIAEVWRQFWLAVPKPPSLVPSPLSTHDHHLQAGAPQWLKHCLNYIQKVADRFAQSTIRRTIQQSVHQTFDVAFEAMFDTSVWWSATESEATLDVFVGIVDDQGESQEDVVALEGHTNNDDDDDSGCQGGVCHV
jgi:hypothetical protein